MVAVGDERGRADRVAFPDAVEGDELVADEADEPGDERTTRWRPAGVDEPADRLPGGENRGHGDHRQDEQPARSSAPDSRRCSDGSAGRGQGEGEHSGTAVSASEKLWIVSASSATEPERPRCELGERGHPDATSETSARGCRARLLQRVVDRVARVVAVGRNERQSRHATDHRRSPVVGMTFPVVVVRFVATDLGLVAPAALIRRLSERGERPRAGGVR